MHYSIWLRRKGEPVIHEDSFLPGVISARLVEHTSAQFAERLGICDTCDGVIAHVIEHGTGKSFCPVLFQDLVKPQWQVRDVLK